MTTTTATITPNAAPPGSYLWDAERGYYGRITLKGTEDQRFTQGGACSFLNGFTKGATLLNPTRTAKALLDKGSNEYIIQGYTLFLGDDANLTCEHWLASACDVLQGVHGIRQILISLSQDPETEEQVKIDTIQKCYRSTRLIIDNGTIR